MYEIDQASRAEVEKAVAIVLNAGHGEVNIKIADHAVVSIRHEATRSIFKGERIKQAALKE